MTELKTLRVCTAKELSRLDMDHQRDPSFLYFLYDKLEIHTGLTLYSGNFSIVETIPAEPVSGVLYICLDDGFAKIVDDYRVINIAEIESDEQKEILKQSGSTFFVNANTRYLDYQNRTISLPFNNGNYELTVNLAKEVKINNNTVIHYNENKNEFEVHGDKLRSNIDTEGFFGSESDSVIVSVDKNRIRANIKVSDSPDNIIKTTPDGIFANARTKLTKKEFQAFIEQYSDYQSALVSYMSLLSSDIKTGLTIMNEGTISQRILTALSLRYPVINRALEEYSKFAAELARVETGSKRYANNQVNYLKAQMDNIINTIVSNPWVTIDGGLTNPDLPPEIPDEPPVIDDPVTPPEEPEDPIIDPDIPSGEEEVNPPTENEDNDPDNTGEPDNNDENNPEVGDDNEGDLSEEDSDQDGGDQTPSIEGDEEGQEGDSETDDGTTGSGDGTSGDGGSGIESEEQETVEENEETDSSDSSTSI